MRLRSALLLVLLATAACGEDPDIDGPIPDTGVRDTGAADTGGQDVTADVAVDTSRDTGVDAVTDADAGGSDASDVSDTGITPGADRCVGDEDAFRLLFLQDEDPSNAATTCAEGACASDQACTTTCVADATGVSEACASCFTEYALCAVDACGDDPIDNGGCASECADARSICRGDLTPVQDAGAADVNVVNVSRTFGTGVYWFTGWQRPLVAGLAFSEVERTQVPTGDADIVVRVPDAGRTDPVAAIASQPPEYNLGEPATVGFFGNAADASLRAIWIREIRNPAPEGVRYRFIMAENVGTVDVWNRGEGETGVMHTLAFGDRSLDAARAAGTFVVGIDANEDAIMEATFTLELVGQDQHNFWIIGDGDLGFRLIGTTSEGALVDYGTGDGT